MGRAVATITIDSSAESSFRELDHVFLQTQTRIWIGEVLHTRLDEQLHISDLLADGELLFEVSKVIWKMLVVKCVELRHVKANKYKPFGARKSSGRYMPYSNVDSFLKICKILGLNGIDLFSPSDVVEKRDIRKVCVCVRSFSKKARSKQLNVPDFDVVAYTIAMPTNVVGCIRRSLELSQCSSTSSDSPYKSSRLKLRRKKLVAAYDRNYDSYSKGSGDSESNYIGVQSYSSSTNYSCDTASLKNSDIEYSPGASSVVKKYTSAQSILQSVIQDQENDEDEKSQYASDCEAISMGSLCSEYVKNDHQLDSMSSPSVDSRMKLYGEASHINNGVRHGPGNGTQDLIDLDLSLGNDASVVEDSGVDNTAERSYTSHQFAFSDFVLLGADNNFPVLFDGEDSMFNLYMGTDSHGSSSTQRTFQNGFGRRFSNDIEDVEVSSMTSMSSVSGRMLKLDFDDQFDTDDYRTANVNFIKMQNYEAESLDKISMRGYESQDMAKYETPVPSLPPDTEKPQLEMKLENSGFSTKLLLQSPDDWQSYTTGYEDQVDSFSSEIDMSWINSGDALWLKDTNFVVADKGKEVIGATMVDSDPDIKVHLDNYLPAACSSNITDIYEDSSPTCNIVTVEGSEICDRQSHIGDGSGLQHQDITIQGISSQGVRTPYMVAVDNTAVNSILIFPANQCKPMAEKHPCLTIESSDSVGKCHQSYTDHNEDHLDCAEYSNKGERKHENVDILATEIADGTKYTSAGVQPGKPPRKPLLKTVVKGTALFGVLFLLLHLRSRSGREKTGEASKQSSQIRKSNGVESSSRKGQKGGRVNGIYPIEKLTFGN